MMASGSTHRGPGVTAGLDAGLARELAAPCEQLGYRSRRQTMSRPPRGLDTLAQFAAATAEVEPGVGVLPLPRYPPAEITTGVDRLGSIPRRCRARPAPPRACTV